ncbi:MAG: tRNA (adenosine(37)-N6)-threonylcarbamoyltransferase complex ATPase subunit type 1 TsaE [Proteobacteria bacterium]|nr:tRNA (adenosine(37)-N6)-threonylcarbamoyltransferase complex ATPase subunit type 1 TsaE [Pseudomonadota bacterium]
MSNRIIITQSSIQTYELGQKLGTQIKNILKTAEYSKQNLKFGFTGDLGAGKTLMIKGIMSKIMPKEEITSPTYTIINEYDVNAFSIFHVDLYRINNFRELEGTGFLEALVNPRAVMFIEWIDRLGNEIDNLCADIVTVDMHYISPEKRKIIIKNWREDL